MNRIEKRMSELKDKNEKAFITYLTAGLPNIEKTVELIGAQEQAGVDVIEIGIPFSDPVADGTVIQNASYQSILGGTTLEKVFDMMNNVRKQKIEVPILFMMYYNTVYHYGLKSFVEKCVECGVDGLIIPDLPFEEQDELKEHLDAVSGSPILIQLISPVSENRANMILENARGFVYCVSQMGVTGKDISIHNQIRNYLTEIKKVSKIPVMMGFGIKTYEDVEPLNDIIDGAIVGSHFIKILEDNNFNAKTAYEYIREFKKGLNR